MSHSSYKIVVASDSFKGTLTQDDVCRIARKTIPELLPDCELLAIPIADGGEGSVDCFLTAAGGERVTLRVRDCLGRAADADYAILPDGRTAVIEVAAAAGLTLCRDGLDPLGASSFGVGEQIADALRRGCRRVFLCLGGSATTDAGCGLAAALGYAFLNAAGERFLPTGGTLREVAAVCGDGVLPELAGAEIVALCDTRATLYGKAGSAFVYAPQKGAAPEEVLLLDRGLRHISRFLSARTEVPIGTLEGGGAAGGIGAGVTAWLGGTLRPGIAAFLELTRFRERIAGADLVITGEGKFDAQSLTGKAVIGVSRACRDAGVPCVALVGMTGDLPPRGVLEAEGLSGIVTTAGDPPRLPRDAAEAGKCYENALKTLILGRFYCR